MDYSIDENLLQGLRDNKFIEVGEDNIKFHAKCIQ